MAKFTYSAGEQHMLATYFQNKPEAFGPFYIGLGVGPAPLSESTTLANITEVTGLGYARKMITRDDNSNTGWLLAGNAVVSPKLVFTNTSPVYSWPAVDYVFLTLAATGTTGPLIAAVDLPDTLIVPVQQSIEVVFRFKTTTILAPEDRFVSLAGAASGNAAMSATATIV